MEYEIVSYSPALMPQLADLRSRVWGRSRADNLAYLKWKYEQNPYLDEPILHVALADGRAVGMRGFFGTCWHIGSKLTTVIPEAADFIIDRDHRGRWLDKRLVEFGRRDLTEKGHQYAFCTNAEPAMRFLRMMAGSRRAAAYQTYGRGDIAESVAQPRDTSRVRPTGWTRVARKLRHFRRIVMFPRFDKWAARVEPPLVATTAPRVAQMSELVTRFADPSQIRHVRDELFYNWKLRNPHSQYRFIFYQQDEKLLGFLTLRQSISGDAVSIVDWATSTTDVWAELLRAIADSNIDRLQITSTKFSEEEKQALHKNGFVLLVEKDTRKLPASGVFIDTLAGQETDSWTLAGQRLLDPDCWDMRMISSDAY